MKLITLMGLVVIEKMQLVAELASYYTQACRRVTVIDNINRMAIDYETLLCESLIRHTGDINADLSDLLAYSQGDAVILALSESANIATFFTTLDNLQDTFPSMIRVTLGLIDLRTCDCFPQTREMLELYADRVIMMPYDLRAIVEGL